MTTTTSSPTSTSASTPVDAPGPQTPSVIDPVLMAVLSSRLDTIVREMENTLLRAGRSAILALARDFSCAIVTADNRLLSSAEGLPVHVIGTEFITEAMTRLHPDLREGDAYLHNDPYDGNTHAADHTILVPVFVAGRHVFTVAAKAHQADAGNSRPTTFMPFVKDVYEEGSLIFTAVKAQSQGKDVDDVIRMCRSRIRVPEQWYGDYLAMVGSARTGERRLHELCERYGVDVVQRFVEEYFDYSERRMAHVISELPAGRFSGSGTHDGFSVVPDGIPINVTINIDSDQGVVDLDLRDNIDCIDLGLNESRTCSINNVMTGFLNSISPDVPHNAGSFRRVRVHLRENCVVGVPRFPHSCSVATTNVGERLVVTTQRVMADALEGYGQAEGACGIGPAFAVISGVQDEEAYINQVFMGSQGGPAGPEHDGWLTYGNAVTNGLMFRDSVEIDEQKFPMRVQEIRISTDSEGSGRRRGAPGSRVVYGPRSGEMEALYISDGAQFPPRGTRGGGSGRAASAAVIGTDGISRPMETIGAVVLSAGELLVHELSGGGGYGPAHLREPERVRHDVEEGYISVERAEEVYAVIVHRDPTGQVQLDLDATARRRA